MPASPFRYTECMDIKKNLRVAKRSGLAGAMLALCLAVAPSGCSEKNRGGTANLPEATLEELNAALGTWMMAKGTLPQSVNELTNFPALRAKRLPAAAPGMKLTIDAGTRRVVFANQ